MDHWTLQDSTALLHTRPMNWAAAAADTAATVAAFQTADAATLAAFFHLQTNPLPLTPAS